VGQQTHSHPGIAVSGLAIALGQAAARRGGGAPAPRSRKVASGLPTRRRTSRRAASRRKPQNAPGMRAWVRRDRGGQLFHRWYQPGVGRYTRPDPLSMLPPQPAGNLFLVNTVSGATLLFIKNLTPASYEYAAANPVVYEDPHGLQAGLQGAAIGRFLGACADDLDRRRALGHQRFPRQPNDFMRHCTVSCESADGICGRLLTRIAGVVNEAQGLIIDIANRQTGAFEFEDFQFNEAGLWCQANRGDCSCEDCCRKAGSAFPSPTTTQPPPGSISGGP